jgi:membrane protein DedA with SNARE-associated domain
MVIPVPGHIGYPVLAGLVFGESAGLPIPGETALIAAGGLVAAGHLSLPLVIATTVAAAIAGDTLGYLLGRRKGREFLLRDGFMADHRRHAVLRADRFFARYGTATVFAGRFVPGVRVVAALMAGATGMAWRRFAIANAAGALLWATTIATLAMIAGAAGSAVFAGMGLVLGGVVATFTWWKQRRSSRERDRQLGPALGAVRGSD